MKYSLVIAALMACASGIKVDKKMSMYAKIKDEPVARSSEEMHAHDEEQADDQNLAQAEPIKAVKIEHDPEDDKKPNEIDSTYKAHISFERNYDMSGHDHNLIGQDASRVGFKIKGKEAAGPKCIEGDWVVLNYQMYNTEDGSLIEDTTASSYPRPLIFQAGRYQVSKCLDIAVQQMRGGENAVVHCPNDLDIGGGVQNTFHTQYGSSWVDRNVDSKYVIALSECAVKPSYFDPPSVIESMTDGNPFYIMSEHPDAQGNSLVVEVADDDLYAPRTTGIHDVQLRKWSGKEKPNKMQQWLWDSEDKSLKSVGITGSALFEGFNRNMIVYQWRGLHNQRFRYNKETERLENRFTGRAMDIKNDKLREGQNILTEEPDQTQGQRWRVVYQGEHGHDHHDE